MKETPAAEPSPGTGDNETTSTATPAAVVDAGDLISQGATVATPIKESPASGEASAGAAAVVDAGQLVDDGATLPPGKGKGNRTLDDYAKLDWTKSNGELAKIAGVSRQRIAQIRADLKEREETEALQQTQSRIGGLPPGNEATNVNGSTPTTAQAATMGGTPAAPAVNYQLMAETVFGMSTGLATMLIGPEWQPRILKNPATGEPLEEKAAVVEALRVYFESKQFQDLPPGYMLAFVVASYAAPRFAHDNTRSKFKLAWHWCKVKVGGWFSRRKKFVPQIVARPTETPKQGNE